MDNRKPAGAPMVEGRRTAGSNSEHSLPRGQVAQPTTSTQRDTPALQAPWLSRHLGRHVRIGLMTGKVLTGELAAYDQFTLEVRPQPGADSVLVYKHAIAYLAPAEAPERQP